MKHIHVLQRKLLLLLEENKIFNKPGENKPKAVGTGGMVSTEEPI